VRSFIFDRPADDFLAVTAFVAAADGAHGLGLEHLSLEGSSGDDGAAPPTMAAVLGAYLARTGVKAVLLGTRRGDPNAGGQAEFCPSSPGWPPFLRVNPILDWGYGDVWAFLDGIGAPYCPLYDLGYTSLGSVGSTSPNAALLRPDGSYAPARALVDGRQERAGRGGGKGREGKSAAAPRPPSAPTRSAALVLVGDELLAARVEDANAGFLCGRLHALGWDVARVAFLPDSVEAVAAEVAAAAAAHTAVVVAGGVGPTDDDVTLAAVAAAFGAPLVRCPDLEGRLRAWAAASGRPPPGDAALKMADAPEGVRAIEVCPSKGGAGGSGAAAEDGDDANAAAAAADPPRPCPFPLLAFRNCFVLPGSPGLLRRKWGALEGALVAAYGPCAPFAAISLRLALEDECGAAPALAAAGAAAGGRARAGSYPLSPPAPDGARVVVVVEGKDAGAVGAAADAAVAALPAGCLLARVEGGSVYRK